MGGDKSLEYIIRHVFLPPELPQKDDEDVEKGTCLIEAVLAALILFRQKHVSEQEDEERAEWSACVKMVENMLELRNERGGGLEADKLSEKLRGMSDGGKVETNEKMTPNPLPLSLSLSPFEQTKNKRRKRILKLVNVLCLCILVFFRYPSAASRLSERRPHHTKTFRRICL